MGEMTPEEIDAALHGPYIIYSPDGTSFIAQLQYDASTIDQALGEDQELWMSYNITGPREEANHTWIADANGELL